MTEQNGSVGSASVPPLFAGFDFGLHPDISLGGIFSYYQASANYGFGGGEWKYTYLTIGARADYHFGKFVPVEKLDLYGGLMLGYGIVSVSSPAAYAGFAGASSSAQGRLQCRSWKRPKPAGVPGVMMEV